ncbi:hypothetical protein SAMN05192540_0285 [Maribacter dokdonensis]|uniref:Chaperone of endosialidase n=1 Tax=Maribacter dokdonensis TaxID=320912 RepID=A0A1H4JCE3_9FLAO|nr:hypothetical protein [Maribacter dokdonensis]SEB43963.1 hypothetical protein SAMN05192540_0285 [Maribacter dokdonensis]
MKAIILFIFFIFLTLPPVFGQIKIGDNPQNIDASSVLELESSSKVLVITRVTTLEMEAITPQRGGLVYNTDTECVNYYDGTQWVNLCDAVNFTITNDPIINGRSTIEITESAAGYNLEVAKNSILGDNIIDGGIGPDDIQDNSITQDKLAAESVGSSELRQNAVGSVEIRDGSIAPEDMANTIADQVLTTDENGIVQWEDTNDLFDLTFDKLDNTLTISRSTTPGVSTISLEALVGSDDQQLDLTGNILSIENDPNTVDLSTYLQQISINNRRITLTNGGFIDLPAGTVNTDNQTLTLTGNTLAISGGNNVNLNKYLDNTDEQQLSIAGNRISLTDGGFVDLPPGTVDTDEQQLSIVGNRISLTDGGFVDIPEGNLSLDDGFIFVGNAASEPTPVAVGGDVTMNNIGEFTIEDEAVTPIMIEPAPGILTEDQVLITTTAGVVEWANFPPGGGGGDDDQNASEVPYDNAASGLTATSTQAAIDELAGAGFVDTDDQNASQVDYDNTTSGLTALTTQAAIDELAGAGFVDTDDQNASQVDYDNTTSGLTATNTQAAIDELAGAGFVDTDEQNIDGSILTGDVLTIGIEGGNNQDVSLATFALDTEVATAIAASDTADGDKSDTNEIQNITSTNGSVTVTPSATGNDFDLAVPGSSDDQNIDGSILTGDVLTIGIEGGNNQDVSLTTFALDTEVATAIAASDTADGDKSDTNEIQNITSTNGSVTVTPSATGNDFDLAVPGSSDDQNIDGSILTGDVLTIGIEGGNNQDVSLATFALDTEVATAIAASDTADGDKSDTNEIQNITSTNGSVTVTPSATGNDFDLSVTSGQNITNANLDLDADRTVGLAGNNLYFTGAGLIGIGTTSPDVKFHVSGGQVRAATFSSGDGLVDGPAYRFSDDSNTGMYSPAADQLALSTEGKEALRIDTDQNVGIGPTFEVNGTTIAARLHVDGDIRAEGEIFTTGINIVPDYVFQKYFLGNSILNPSYEFNDLAEIEAFVKENKHLPGIQSAQAVKEQGFWNVSESSRVNLEKIEELFLHTIEQEKKIKELQKANTNMSLELEALKTQMKEIKTMLLEKQNN